MKYLFKNVSIFDDFLRRLLVFEIKIVHSAINIGAKISFLLLHEKISMIFFVFK